MSKFFETFNVLEEEGNWTRGYTTDTLGCGFKLTVQDICTPTAPGSLPSTPLGHAVTPFAVSSYYEVPTMCAPPDVLAFVRNATRASFEWAVTSTLWNGVSGADDYGDMYLTNTDVATVAPGSDPYTTVGTLLQQAFENAPYISPVIHLGWQSAMALQLGLATLGLPYVVGHGYPYNAIAVTGPITVRVTPLTEDSLDFHDSITTLDRTVNRQYFQVNRIAAIEFDPCQAVRSS